MQVRKVRRINYALHLKHILLIKQKIKQQKIIVYICTISGLEGNGVVVKFDRHKCLTIKSETL